MPEKILLIPNKIGLKNIIRVSKTVKALFSPLKPGAIKLINRGQKIIRINEIKIMTEIKIFKIPLVNCQASFLSLCQNSLKTGIKAAEIAPTIKIL